MLFNFIIVLHLGTIDPSHDKYFNSFPAGEKENGYQISAEPTNGSKINQIGWNLICHYKLQSKSQ